MTESTTPAAQRGALWLALRVLDEPGEVFRQLTARPRWVVPLLFLLVGSVAIGFGTPESLLRQRMEQVAATMRERAPDRVSEEDAARMVSRAVSTSGRARTAGGAAVFSVVILLIAAGVLQAIFGAVGTVPLRFKDEFAIVTHAYVPQVVGLLLYVLLARFMGLPDLQFSLAFLFPEGFLRSFAMQFSLFAAWNVALLALGNQIRAGIKTVGMPLTILVSLWVLVNLGLAGLGSLFGGLAG